MRNKKWFFYILNFLPIGLNFFVLRQHMWVANAPRKSLRAGRSPLYVKIKRIWAAALSRKKIAIWGTDREHCLSRSQTAGLRVKGEAGTRSSFGILSRHIGLLEVGEILHMGLYGREFGSGQSPSTRRVSLD